jgi:signal transduction histidine kinase
VVGVALAVGAAALLLTLRHSLVRSGDDVARLRAQDLATLAERDALPPTLPVPSEDDVAQVLDASGAVVAGSAGHRGGAPIASFTPPGDEPAVRTIELRDNGEAEPYRVWGLRAGEPGREYTVYVATSLEAVDETVATLRGALVVGLPALLLVLAGISWVLLGRALRPVEAIRSEVADISEHALDRRVPVPDTADEIGRLARTMNAMLDRLQAASQQQRSFLADASHELQSPLAAFRAQLEVALAHPDAVDLRATASALHAESQRMERLVRDLLFLARSADGPAPARGSRIDLDDIVLDEAARLRATTAVRIDTSRVSGAPLLGSADELTRLARNLLENAERHAASTVRAALTSEEGTVRLIVEDDGPGVAPDQRQRIFDRFTRVDGARARDVGGTGLGLAIVKDVVDRHGGTVSVEDCEPGARFVVELPMGPAGSAAC